MRGGPATGPYRRWRRPGWLGVAAGAALGLVPSAGTTAPTVLGALACCCAAGEVVRAAGEEVGPASARPDGPRRRAYGTVAVVAATGSAALLLAGGAAAGVTAAATGGSGAGALVATLLWAPAAWLTLALALALWAVGPRSGRLAWIVPVALLAQLLAAEASGSLWLRVLAPLHHVARAPRALDAWPTLVVLTGAAILCAAAGAFAYEDRDPAGSGVTGLDDAVVSPGRPLRAA